MTWLIIILILAVAIGPVLYLLPSGKDKRLTALREQARKAGLTVQITTLPKLDPPAHERVTAGGKTLDPRHSCAAYKLPVGQSLAGVETLLLLKIPPEPTVSTREVIAGWDLNNGASMGFWQIYAADGGERLLVQALAKLPEDTLGFSLDDRFISCFWQERAPAETDAVGEMRTVLEEVRADLCARFAVSAS